jgi:hypothetical protein
MPKKAAPPLKGPPLDDEAKQLLAAIKIDPPGGLSKDFIDNAFWQNLPMTSPDWEWLTALDRLDRLGDEKLLQRLLKSCEPSPRIKRYIADQIERKRRRKGKSSGKPKLPAYTLSRNDALLLLANEFVKGYIQRGDLVDTALDRVRDEWAWVPINRSTLAAVHNGSHASLNRHRKRL